MMDDQVLQETRTLLNSLNEENSELKVHAEHLTQQWRHVAADLEAERARFAQLEHDSKQINANLIKQLQAQAADAKRQQAAHDVLERRAQAMEVQLERLAEEKAAAEDRCAAVQRSLEDAIAREERERGDKLDARAEADRCAAQLQESFSSQREKALDKERGLAQRCEELAAELRKQQDLVASVKRQADISAQEAERRAERLQQQLRSAEEQAARTRHAEAESGFAHDEMRATAESFFETLSDLHARNRAAEIDAADVMNSIGRITAKFRAVAQAAATQRHNSEELVAYYINAHEEIKSALAAAAAENTQLRTALASKVEAAVAVTEKGAREAAVRQERHHQEQLAAAIAELEAKQRERDAAVAEAERLADGLRGSSETEKQLRAFSEQLYADVVAANKVASEAAERERAAKAQLTTVEHTVAERVRKEMTAAFQNERSRLQTELTSTRSEYDLEIAELRAELEDNASTLQSALSRMGRHHHHHNHHQSQNQQHQQQNQQHAPRASRASQPGGQQASPPQQYDESSVSPVRNPGAIPPPHHQPMRWPASAGSVFQQQQPLQQQ